MLIIIISAASLLAFDIVSAQNLGDAFNNANEVAGSAGYDTEADIYEIGGTVVRTLLSLLGVIFMGLLVYGGYLWMTDRGNEDMVRRAKKLISAAVIGLVIVLSAFAISIFVFENLEGRVLDMEPAAEEGASPEEG